MSVTNRRIACLRVPDFLITAHLRSASGSDPGPAVVVGDEGARARVVAVSDAARRAGLAVGMRAADARGVCPDVREWIRDPALYERVRTELAAALLAATPRVGRAGSDAFWLDAGGWGRRGGEGAFVQTARSAALAAGYPEARLGVADTPAAARAATRLRDRAVHRVPPGGDARFLATLPLRVLPVSIELRELLEALGLETVGDLAELEPAAVEARLGAEGLRAHRWARGLDDGRERPGPGPATGEWAAEVELPGPAETLEPILFLLKSCLDHLSGALAAEGLCAAALELVLETEDGPVTERVRPARPTRRAAPLFDLCREALDGLQLPGRVLGLRTVATEVEPAGAEQTDLFEPPRPDPDALATALTRLRRRWGPESVVEPRTADSHRPEATGRWAPVELSAEPSENGSAEVGEGVAPPGGRPVLVLRLWPRPRPVQVRIAAGRPGAVRLEGEWRTIQTLRGPERLSGEWWDDPYRREYYRVGTEAGDLLWVFFEPRRGAWFWHGWWD